MFGVACLAATFCTKIDKDAAARFCTLHVLLRVAYCALYALQSNQVMAGLRSTAWAMSLACCGNLIWMVAAAEGQI